MEGEVSINLQVLGGREEGETRCFLDAAPSKLPLVRSHCFAAVPHGPAKGNNRLRNRLNDSRHLIKCLAERPGALLQAAHMPTAQPGR